MEDVADAGAVSKGGAHEREDDHSDGSHGEAAQQRLRGGARAPEAGIDERHGRDCERSEEEQSQREGESCFVEGHHWRARHQWPSPVTPRAEVCDWGPRLANMWPRTATTMPIASTAIPQTINAARSVGSENRRMAARERKNPAGMTSNPAYFMVLPFKPPERRRCFREDRGNRSSESTSRRCRSGFRTLVRSVKKD